MSSTWLLLALTVGSASAATECTAPSSGLPEGLTQETMQLSLGFYESIFEGCITECGEPLCQVFQDLVTAGETENMTEDEKKALPLCQADDLPCTSHSNCTGVTYSKYEKCESPEAALINMIMSMMAPCFEACGVSDNLATAMFTEGVEPDLLNPEAICSVVCMGSEPKCDLGGDDDDDEGDDDDDDDESSDLDKLIAKMMNEACTAGLTPCDTEEPGMEYLMMAFAPCTSACGGACELLQDTLPLNPQNATAIPSAMWSEHACAITCMNTDEKCEDYRTGFPQLQNWTPADLADDLECDLSSTVGVTISLTVAVWGGLMFAL